MTPRRRGSAGASGTTADPQIGFLPAAPFTPPADVMETHDEYIVVVDVAGADDRAFDIAIEGKTLIIGGTRPEHSQGKRRYHHGEIRIGPFQRAVTLPGPVVADDARARYERGILRITLRKASTTSDKVLRL
ncbi:MAG TPA: Hsp20/alpha crystallin family protein [Gemmatimonadaceae bacterium]|nr:Hsp20/alpha crystallin family protein [Gemmatimonadaceae bacterium]